MPIIGYEDPITKALARINATLYLTGSRYFGGATISSDYDFFTQDTSLTRMQLIWADFKCVSDHDYSDRLTISVYRNYLDDGTQIDVQLVRDVDLKLRAQNLLKALGLHTRDKLKMSCYWNDAIAYLINQSR